MRRLVLLLLLAVSLRADTFKTDDGVTLHYERVGRGKTPVVLLAGGPGFSSEYMRTIADALKKKHAFVLFDQRGTGKSVTETLNVDTLAFKRLVADLDALRAELKVNKLTIVGHSWGGILSMMYAAQHPDRVRALVLVDSGGPSLAGLAKFNANFNARMTAEDLAAVKEWSAPEKMAGNRRRATTEVARAKTPPYFHDRAKAKLLMDAMTEEWFNADVFWPIVSQMTPATFNFGEALKKLDAPVLIIHGKQDPLETAQEVHDTFPGSRLELIDNAGHFPWLEQPERVYALLDAFLSGVRRR
jgi:proline iminopeptidase